MHASLARPSTGEAVNAIFSAPPSSPTTVFLLARGCTRTEKLIPEAVSFSAITSYMIGITGLRSSYCVGNGQGTDSQ